MVLQMITVSLQIAYSPLSLCGNFFTFTQNKVTSITYHKAEIRSLLAPQATSSAAHCTRPVSACCHIYRAQLPIPSMISPTERKKKPNKIFQDTCIKRLQLPTSNNSTTCFFVSRRHSVVFIRSPKMAWTSGIASTGNVWGKPITSSLARSSFKSCSVIFKFKYLLFFFIFARYLPLIVSFQSSDTFPIVFRDHTTKCGGKPIQSIVKTNLSIYI